MPPRIHNQEAHDRAVEMQLLQLLQAETDPEKKTLRQSALDDFYKTRSMRPSKFQRRLRLQFQDIGQAKIIAAKAALSGNWRDVITYDPSNRTWYLKAWQSPAPFAAWL